MMMYHWKQVVWQENEPSYIIVCTLFFCFFVVTTHDHYSFGECGTISRRTRSLRRKQRNTHRFPNPMGNQRHRVYPSLKSCIIVSDNVECVNGRSIGHPKE